VATLICDDMTQGHVAARLGLSERVVQDHVLRIRVKTGRATPAAAIADLVRRGEL
jgi:DNA-binding CsgD family transcriptional regulator